MKEELYFVNMIAALGAARKEVLQSELPVQIMEICMYVNAHPGCCQDDIVKELKTDKSQLARNVKKAQEMNLLERKASPIDCRKAELYILEEGKHIAQQTEEALLAWQNSLLEPLSISEKRQLEYLIGRVSGIRKR